jgi:hypothetical protein
LVKATQHLSQRNETLCKELKAQQAIVAQLVKEVKRLKKRK